MIDSDGLGIIEVCMGFGASAAADVFIRMTLKKQEKHSILYYSDCSLFGDFLSIVNETTVLDQYVSFKALSRAHHTRVQQWLKRQPQRNRHP